MKVLLGGTFSILHAAHKEMIMRGAHLGELYIGITSDSYKFDKKYKVPPYETRKQKVESFLQEKGIMATISPLDNPYGKTLDPEFDAIVVSNETLDFVKNINMQRKSLGIKPLMIENIGTFLADDLMPLKSERIINGQIDENGRRLKEIKIGLASSNPEKIKGLEMFAKKVFRNYKIMKFNSANRIDQPFGEEIFKSAEMRINAIPEEIDYAIGIEAGIIKIGGKYYDIHYTLVRDYLGAKISGISSALPLNSTIVSMIKVGKNLEQATDFLVGSKGTGKKHGAIFYLSGGIKKRRELVYESVLSAFTERLSQKLTWRY